MEEHSQKCSNSSSGCGGGSSFGRSTKKAKQKKVPQRGLGVAQLEKIRLEEQQKKDGPSSSPKSSFLSVTLPNLHQTNQPSSSSSSIPFPPPPSPIGLHSPNPLSRPPPLPHTTIDGTVPLPNSAKWPPKIWNSLDYSLDKASSCPDPGLAIPSGLSLPYESNPMWHLQGLMPRSSPFQEPSPMVNVSSVPSSSSVLNFQMEPPSNQSFYSNYRPMWPDEEKMVGVKRPYPFSMESPTGPSFNCKLPTIALPMSEDPTSCANGGSAFTLEPSHPICRQVPENSNENAGFGGDFLTLGPPKSHAPKFKQASDYLTLPNHELPDFDSLPYQTGSSGWNQEPAFYSFLPLAKVQTSQATAATTTTSMNCCNGELGESIDLNLKL